MKTAEHLTLHDKQIAAIRALIKDGMQMVIETRRDIRETRKDMRATQKNLADLIAVLGRGTNGRP